MKKMAGYILMILGLLIVLVWTYGSKFNITILSELPKSIVWITAFVLFVVGVLIGVKKSEDSKKSDELPIYHGEKIVGYRRTEK